MFRVVTARSLSAAASALPKSAASPLRQQLLRTMATMKALVYEGKNKYSILERPKPALSEETDAIVKVSKTTICGTDLHILKGDVPSIPHGRVLGHEGLGTIESVGTGVSAFAPGDRVIISCITACGTCPYCRKGMPSHCTTGGWTLGNTIDGTQAEYVRIPHADASLYRIPRGVDEDALVMISDILPTSLECGTLNGQVKPGSTVAVVGAGPVGLSAVMTAQLFSPSTLISIDLDKNRLEVAKKLGATHTVVSGPDAVQEVMEITGGMGVDTAIEAVGMKPTFELCEEIIGVGGHIANIGVHGGVVDLHMEKLWDRNIGITTRLVDAVTSPMLIRLLEGGKLNAGALITHRYKFSEMEQAYDAFAAASQNKALKVIINID